LSRKRVFLYVQHLLVVGHLKRAATLARALARAGLDVTFASGGMPAPGLALEDVRLEQLPAASAADLTFRTLLDAEGRPVDEPWRERRRAALLGAWRAADPQVLLVELFPFGRRQMRFELVPLLEEARAAARRPLIVCSVRDILGGGQKDPEKQDAMLETFERYFDRVLVHSDPAMVRFEETFRHADRIRERLHYTGFITDRLAASSRGETSGAGEVLVSAGGGAVGARLLEAAIRARGSSALKDRAWRVLTGVNAKPEELEALTKLAGEAEEGIVVERFREDLASRLKHCAVSVSQAGYNTLMEVLQARARAVVVPFAEGGETEQALRARLLAERGLLSVLHARDATPEALAAAIDRAAAAPRPPAGAVDLGGAERSAMLVAGWAAGRPC